MKPIFVSQKGFSLPEILVSVGILGVIAIGAGTFMKNLSTGEADFKHQLEKTEAAKLIEVHLRAKSGCLALVGKAPGQTLTVEYRPGTFITSNTKIRDIEVKDLRFEKFLPTNTDGSMGIAEVKVSLSHDKDKKSSVMSFPMPVRMAGGVIKDCSFGNIRDFQEMVDELCSEAYGIVSEDLTCVEVVAKLHKLATESICQDLFGARPAALAAERCDLSQVHFNKKCPTGELLVGFNGQNEVDCDP